MVRAVEGESVHRHATALSTPPLSMVKGEVVWPAQERAVPAQKLQLNQALGARAPVRGMGRTVPPQSTDPVPAQLPGRLLRRVRRRRRLAAAVPAVVGVGRRLRVM